MKKIIYRIEKSIKKIVFSIAKKNMLFLQCFFRKDTYVLFDNLYEKNAECIDTYCIFQYMQRRNIKCKYVIFRDNPLYEELKVEGKLKDIKILKRSCKYDMSNNYDFFYLMYFDLLKAKALVTSFGELNQDVTRFLYKNKKITYVHTDHGSILLKTFVLATDYFSPRKFNKFLVCSDKEFEIFKKYGWEEENLIKIGLPRWDLLLKKKSNKKTIFVMFTWRTSFGRWNKNKFKTPLKETQYYKGIESLVKNQRLQSLLKEYNVRFQYTLHHSLINQCDECSIWEMGNIEYVPCENISQYISSSDLFITDYSSLFFDFAFLYTPIIFYRPDFDDITLLESDRGDMENAKIYDNDLFNVCYDVDLTVDCIEKYIKNNFLLEEENRRKTDALFCTKKDITKKLTNYLESL